MTTNYIHQYPFIRLVIPWIAGVFCGEHFLGGSSELFWGGLAFCLFACLAIAFYFIKRYSLRWCFGAATFILCFIGGWIGITCQLKQTDYTFPKEETVYRAMLTDTPKAKERAYLCPVTLEERCDSAGVYPVERKAILYLLRDSATAISQSSAITQLKAGDELLISSRIAPPANGKNFDEFDYARYLKHKGISGTGYVATGKWRLLSSTPASSIRFTANTYRERVISLYRKLGFSGDELAVLSALTVGDKTELSESVRESYSVAGASHVLALSGLHIGLLYVLLFFLLKPVARMGIAGRIFRTILLLLLLWSFAFFTGLSSSVVRSVCMFSILAIAELFSRKTFTFNTLAATALIMLLINPLWLFDIGFQLSFMAVASILLVQKPVYRLIPVKNRIGKYAWGLMSVSIATQLGTAPLVLYYFSRFSTHFLLTNLVVIPLVTLILYAAIVMLLLTPLPWAQSLIAVGVKSLLKGLNVFIQWIEQLPYASIDGIGIYQVEVCGIYLILALLLYYLVKRRFSNLILCLCSILLLSTYHVTMHWVNRPQPSIVFYNVRGCPAVHCISSDRQSWIIYGDTLPDNKERLQRVANQYWNRCQLFPPKEVTADYQDARLRRHEQIISYQGCRVCMITDNHWRNKSAATPLYIHYLYLCKGYEGHLEELARLFSPSCVIIDASLSVYRKQLYEEECKQTGLRFISLSEEGSVRFLL
ncbi:ComEC/Rec2 family competence protein [uncultured Bacteroides sp.]|uniref:ComEC/Rec2 family competence protein n=1 Tax=uncultured Bacteroides sp. TaxID=162156 RepID=UPI0025FCB7DA|nr:ComEC/Rec2 family competence protein [uncultured Bacteroides sp.]